jgi:hypothetical protein
MASGTSRHSDGPEPKRKQTAAQLANLTGGSRKGVPNKTTVAVKDMILEALSSVGGAAYLARQAEENPPAFMTLVGKLVPLDVKNHTTLDVTMKAARDAAAQAFIRSAQEEAEGALLQ